VKEVVDLTVAVYFPVAEPTLRLNVKVPIAPVRLTVNGLVLVSTVVAPKTPVPATTVHVPPETVIVVEGLAPDPPARDSVIVVRVEAAV